MHWPEREVWRMTPYKIMTLFNIHKRFNRERFTQDAPSDMDAIDYALGGL